MAGKIRKLIGILLLLTAILVTQIPLSETQAANGTTDFQMNEGTLLKYTGTASTVSVPDTVKKIGEEAFAGNQSLNVVSLGKNTKSVDYAAFLGCTYLSRVTVPDEVTSLDHSVFADCISLTKCNLGKKVKDIGNGVFAGCDSLKTISIDKDNPYLIFEKGALYNKDKTILYAYLNGETSQSYQMPNTVEKICSYAFWGNQNLESITLSSSLKEISGFAFANCKNLQELAIPYAVKSIDAKAFSDCISLREITIPASVSYIDDTAFDGCNKLSIIAEEGSIAEQFKQMLEQRQDVEQAENELDSGIDISQNEVVVVGSHHSMTTQETDASDSATTGWVTKDASKDPSNVEYMPQSDPLEEAEEDSVLAKSIVVGGHAVLFMDSKGVPINEGITQLSQNEQNEQNEQNIYDQEKGGYLPKYAVAGDKIAAQAYYADSDMEGYYIPDGIQNIGDFSYARSALKSINIPQGVKNIGYGAFYHCDSLTDVTIPTSVTEIETAAFEKTPWLTNWKSTQDGSDFLIVGDQILLAYKGTTNQVIIPDGVRYIAPDCFLNHTEIESVSLPDSIKIIGEDAFRGATSLRSVTGGNYLEEIRDRAFLDCPLDTLTIPATVKKIGLRAVDFSKTKKDNATKSVVFLGKQLPELMYGKVTQRLEKEEYRKDALYNVFYAIVDEECNSFENTVLDSEKLGFSGMILSLEKYENGNETGYAILKQNTIFSEEVLEEIPKSIVLNGKTYTIKDAERIQTASIPEVREAKKDLTVSYNGSETKDITASFSEKETVGTLNIADNETAKETFQAAYEELFKGQAPQMSVYAITLKDVTDTVFITQFGKAELTVTMPLKKDIQGSNYHVVTMDSDGQLEEVESMVEQNGSISFTTSHLSDFAIFATGENSVSLKLENGKIVRNFKKDVSPDTGDYSIPVQYMIAAAMCFVSLFLFLYKGKRKTPRQKESIG
ncbi:MAG: leucine-rich repeat domain-containing protein [Lachnospiraceae bacterium]